MTKEEKKVMDEMRELMKDMHTAMVGNPSLGMKGLVQRQEEDEAYQRIVKDELTSIQSSLKKLHAQQGSQKEYLEQVDDRVKKTEKFMDTFNNIWTSLKGSKKAIVWLVAAIATAITSVAHFWDEIKQFF